MKPKPMATVLNEKPATLIKNAEIISPYVIAHVTKASSMSLSITPIDKDNPRVKFADNFFR